MWPYGGLYGICCWCLEAGGVGVGVEAIDCGPSNELSTEWGLCMPFMRESVPFCEKLGGGGYEEEPAWTVEAMMSYSGRWC